MNVGQWVVCLEGEELGYPINNGPGSYLGNQLFVATWQRIVYNSYMSRSIQNGRDSHNGYYGHTLTWEGKGLLAPSRRSSSTICHLLKLDCSENRNLSYTILPQLLCYQFHSSQPIMGRREGVFVSFL